MSTVAASRVSPLAAVNRRLAFWREFARGRVAVVSLIIVLLAAALAIAAPLLPIPNPMAFSDAQYDPPSLNAPMGMDNGGRSVLSRVIWGTRLGLAVGLGAAGIAMILGTVLGAISGYFGGLVDDLLSRLFDIFLLIPSFFLALVVISLFGASTSLVMLVIGLTHWPRSARIMRAQVLTLKNRTFVQASRVSGLSHLQALFLHVIPNGLAPVITYSTILMGSAILTEAGLSFLGLGDPNSVSWGQLISEGQRHLRVAPWMSLFPGLTMLIVVCALNLVGDGLNFAVNPQSRERTGSAKLPTQPLTASPVGVSSPEITQPAILDVRNLTMYYASRQRNDHSVDGVSLHLARGESVGLVGESGCGKTSVGLTLMRVLPRNARIIGGSVRLRGEELLSMDDEQFKAVRWSRISMIFQSAMNSLDPVQPVGRQLAEAYSFHRPKAGRGEAMERVKELFGIVGIPASRLGSYPHELSGGMRQRVMIALALILEPEVIIADEPTTALDVLVQDQILFEMERLQQEMNLSMLLISHDMGIVAETCKRIAVMYAGQIVEEAPSSELFDNARHPYARGLLASLPTLTGPRKALVALPGESTAAVGVTRGCRFAARCPLSTDLCRTVEPALVRIETAHLSRCHFALTQSVEQVWGEGVIAHA